MTGMRSDPMNMAATITRVAQTSSQIPVVSRQAFQATWSYVS